MSRRALSILFAAFLLSVAVRLPQLDRPLSAHHEFCTAFTLIALTNWYEDGFATHHGMPSGGFVREGERFFPLDRFSRNERALGLYYFSYPPLAYDLGYALFRVAGTAPNALGLQLFGLIFHLVTAIALFFASREMMGRSTTPVPLFAALLYLFLPATLWFHSNVYVSDTFVQNFWVPHLYFAMRLFREGVAARWGTRLLFGLTLFLTVYTSWVGVFAAAAAVLIALLRWRHRPDTPLFAVVWISALAVVAALGLTAWRYLQVVDAQALIAHFGQRFAVRGSFSMPEGPGPLLRQLAVNYRLGFLPILLLLGILAVQRSRRVPAERSSPSDLALFVSLAGLPVLLDHVFLLQYAEHDFAALKAAPLLCGLAGYGLAQLPVRWGQGALAATCMAGVLYFYRINPLPGHDHGRYVQEQELGRSIAQEAAPDEVVFTIGISTEPQVVWYARRNVIGVATADDARRILLDRGLRRGAVFQAGNTGWSVMHIDLTDASD